MLAKPDSRRRFLHRDGSEDHLLARIRLRRTESDSRFAHGPEECGIPGIVLLQYIFSAEIANKKNSILFPVRTGLRNMFGSTQKVVHPAGLEPTTYCSGGSRSIQMSYGCILSGVIFTCRKAPAHAEDRFFRLVGVTPFLPASQTGNDIR